MIERHSTRLSVRRQCRLLEVDRNRLDAAVTGPRNADMGVCRLIDEIPLRALALSVASLRRRSCQAFKAG